VFRSARVWARLPVSAGERHDSSRSGRHVHVRRQQPGRIQGECRPRPSQGTCSDPLISLILSLSFSLALSISVFLFLCLICEFSRTKSTCLHKWNMYCMQCSKSFKHLNFMRIILFVHTWAYLFARWRKKCVTSHLRKYKLIYSDYYYYYYYYYYHYYYYYYYYYYFVTRIYTVLCL
jgi:hypothetical protein